MRRPKPIIFATFLVQKIVIYFFSRMFDLQWRWCTCFSFAQHDCCLSILVHNSIFICYYQIKIIQFQHIRNGFRSTGNRKVLEPKKIVNKSSTCFNYLFLVRSAFWQKRIKLSFFVLQHCIQTQFGKRSIDACSIDIVGVSIFFYSEPCSR